MPLSSYHSGQARWKSKNTEVISEWFLSVFANRKPVLLWPSGIRRVRPSPFRLWMSSFRVAFVRPERVQLRGRTPEFYFVAARGQCGPLRVERE